MHTHAKYLVLHTHTGTLIHIYICVCGSPRASRWYNSSANGSSVVQAIGICEDSMSPAVFMYVCASRVSRRALEWRDMNVQIALKAWVELTNVFAPFSLACNKQTRQTSSRKEMQRYFASSCSALASGACGYFPFILCVLFSFFLSPSFIYLFVFICRCWFLLLLLHSYFVC